MSKTRSFVVTNFNLDTDYQKLITDMLIRYIGYGEETCPTTGRKHHQAFCYFYAQRHTGKRALKMIADMFRQGKEGVSVTVAPMKGSLRQNEDYCSKESKLCEFGEKPSPGTRGDIEEVKKQIISGEKTSDDICEESPEFHHQYGRTLDRLEMIALRKKWRTEMTRGIWYTGPTGVGKSHKAFDGFHPTTHYVKTLEDEWWDGYKGQPIVIFNEFRGQIKFSELLDLMDKWPKSVKQRNREPVPFLAKEIRIACIKSPQEVYYNVGDEPWGQFHRRCEVVDLINSSKGPIITPLSTSEPIEEEGAAVDEERVDEHDVGRPTKEAGGPTSRAEPAIQEKEMTAIKVAAASTRDPPPTLAEGVAAAAGRCGKFSPRRIKPKPQSTAYDADAEEQLSEEQAHHQSDDSRAGGRTKAIEPCRLQASVRRKSVRKAKATRKV